MYYRCVNTPVRNVYFYQPSQPEIPAGPHNFRDIDYEIISIVSLPLLLIQEGQLSVTGENMCTSTG